MFDFCSITHRSVQYIEDNNMPSEEQARNSDSLLVVTGLFMFINFVQKLPPHQFQVLDEYCDKNRTKCKGVSFRELQTTEFYEATNGGSSNVLNVSFGPIFTYVLKVYFRSKGAGNFTRLRAHIISVSDKCAWEELRLVQGNSKILKKQRSSFSFIAMKKIEVEKRAEI